MEVKSDFKFELTDLNYLCSHITCHLIIARAIYLKWPLRLLTASEVTFDHHCELSGLNNLCSSASLAPILLEKPFVPKVSLLLLLRLCPDDM